MVRLTPDGRVLEIRGVEAMVARSFGPMMRGMTASRAAAMEKIMGDSITTSLKSSLTQTTGIYPPRPVTVGDSWPQSFNSTGEDHSTLTLKKRANGIATVTQSGTFAPPPEIVRSHSGVPLKFGLVRTRQGTTDFDEASGLPRHAISTQRTHYFLPEAMTEISAPRPVLSHIYEVTRVTISVKPTPQARR